MDMTPFKQQMDKAIAYFEGELKALQIGRASAGLVENITVEASYGPMKIPQIAHVTLMDGQTLKIEPWDKNELKHVEKAIYDANAGLTPQNEGSYVIVKIPALTQERRIEITKQVKAMGEDIKGRVRMIRQDAMKQNKTIFDAKEIGEDEKNRNEKDIDILIKGMNEKIDEHVKNKSEEVMKV
ncbi:MAG: ribosome recycling factor [Candidatus Absconditabacterales bacterium]